uniref:Uncharacterized protein n=1 Tax=Glossina palpalis gambiensis TaxID=67801 RepID=A0A1B0C116_9MUSC
MYINQRLSHKIIIKSGDDSVAEYLGIMIDSNITKSLVKYLYNPHKAHWMDEVLKVMDGFSILYILLCGDLNLRNSVLSGGLKLVNLWPPPYASNYMSAFLHLSGISHSSFVLHYDQISLEGISDRKLYFGSNIQFDWRGRRGICQHKRLLNVFSK